MATSQLPLRTLYQGPAWRAALARKIAQKEYEPVDKPDSLVLTYAQYLRARVVRPARAGNHYPLLAAAEQLLEDKKVTDRMRLMIVGDVAPPAIAKHLNLDQQVVELFESLFFDARTQRERIVWMSTWVFSPLERAGEHYLAACLRAALAGGPEIVDLIFESEVEFPLDLGDSIFARRVKLDMLIDRATQFAPYNDYTAMEFVKIGAKLSTAERQLDLQERRFNEACKQAARDYEIDKARLSVRKEVEITRQLKARQATALAEANLAEAQVARAKLGREPQGGDGTRKPAGKSRRGPIGPLERVGREIKKEMAEKAKAVPVVPNGEESVRQLRAIATESKPGRFRRPPKRAG